MKMHEMNLRPKFYDYIKDGTKRIELRLHDYKRSRIHLGDIIVFSKAEDEKLMAEVVGLLCYRSFEELVEDYDISVLADASMTKRELLDTLSGFYPADKQEFYGVVGIRIRPIDALPNQNGNTSPAQNDHS